ncbi:MAG: hypothetical protein K2X38_09730 [Gemmataceae bacterium]|nr:hypothetical protein [Gemmataceae bacterium]
MGLQTRRHAETSVKHCWNWATKHPSPVPYLSTIYRPFSSVERTSVPLKALNENDLIALKEIEAVFAAAEMDLDQFRLRVGSDARTQRLGRLPHSRGLRQLRPHAPMLLPRRG